MEMAESVRSDCDYSRGLSTSASGVTSLGIIPFGFHSKTSYDADGALGHFRSKCFKLRGKSKDDDVWKRPPPDMRLVSFEPVPPKRNSMESMRPWEYGTIPGQRNVSKRYKENAIPHALRDQEEEQTRFDTLFRQKRPFTAKKEFVTEGMNKPEQYRNPQPHDFRDYPPIKKLGLPEFKANKDPDPFKIKFKSDRLNIIHGLATGPAQREILPGERQMAPPLSSKEKWESALALEQNRYPNKFAGFTRFRLRNRNPYSAFMERAEGQLQRKWAQEELDRSIEQYQTS